MGWGDGEIRGLVIVIVLGTVTIVVAIVVVNCSVLDVGRIGTVVDVSVSAHGERGQV